MVEKEKKYIQFDQYNVDDAFQKKPKSNKR